MTMERRSILMMLIIIILALTGFLIRAFLPSQNVITLTKDGFSPQAISVNEGETVYFKSELGQPFWPASDLHPTHALYADFDPGEPLPATSTWAFKFEKQGTWTFHDHLAPRFTGVIQVGGDSSDVCEQSSQACWQRLLKDVLKERGVAAAFDEAVALYSSEPLFASDCHDYFHRISEAAYESFDESGKALAFEGADHCGYGFYHGFMEKMLSARGGLSRAGGFCRDIDERSSFSVASACYHGLGHGAAALSAAQESNFGDPYAIAEDAKDICVKALGSEQLFRCASGAFMEIFQYIADDEYGLSADIANPLGICESETIEDVRRSCYSQSYPLISSLSGGDFSAATAYIENIPEDSNAAETTVTIASTLLKIGKIGSLKAIQSCRSLREDLRPSCIAGVALSEMLSGLPDKEYVVATEFCSNKELTLPERDACFSVIFREGRGKYDEQTFLDMCSLAEEGYRASCRGMLKGALR